MPHFEPITRAGLVQLLVRQVLELRGRALVAVDGADAAEPVPLAEEIAAALRATGRSAAVVSLHDYIRPASLRLEFGHTDEMSYRTAWFDYAALDREVIQALRERGQWLPALWDESRDRSAREPIRPAASDTVVLIAGPMLLSRGLTFDVTVHLAMSESAIRRRTAADQAWTIPALMRYEDESPTSPTFFLRWDHPDRPAVRSGDTARH